MQFARSCSASSTQTFALAGGLEGFFDMASPFKLFRKHMKPLLAVFMSLLIVAWLAGGALTTMGRQGSGGGKTPRTPRAVAVRWNGGKLTNQDLDELVTRRRIVNAFLKQVEYDGAVNTVNATQVEPPPIRVPRLLGPEKPQEGVEQSVVRTRLFADAARDAGMRISDASIVQYLDELGRGRVNHDDMRTILGRLQVGGGRVPIEYVIEGLREELLARNYFTSQQYVFKTVTPEQRWEDWQRANDRVVIEAAAIPVESLVAKVPEPTDAELAEFFTKYKDREASPDLWNGTTELPSAMPGFKIPRKIDLQFVEASYNDVLKKVEGEVTEAEIAKYYEENKDPLFIKADTTLMDEKGEKKKADEGATQSKAAAGTTETKPAEPGNQPEKEKPAPAPESSPEAKSPGDAPTEGKSQQPPATEESPSSKNDATDTATPEEKKSSEQSAPRKPQFQLVAFAQDAATDSAAKSDKEATPADASATSDKGTASGDAVANADKPLAKPAEAPVSLVPPANAPAAASPPADASKATPAGATTPPAKQKPVEFQPLDKVRDQIRKQLAQTRVTEQLTKVMSDLETEVTGEYQRYFNAVARAQAEEHAAPAPPKSLADLGPLAEKRGLKHGATGPVSVLQLRDMPLGKSVLAGTGAGVLTELFATTNLDLYQPFLTVDIDGNRFLAMKTSDTPARVPTLAEARAEVVRAWKQQKAADLALKDAQELAKKAQDAKSPLSDFFADSKSVKVLRTDPFSFLTGGDVGLSSGQLQPFRLGEPDGVVAAGPEFMQYVFGLKTGDVGATLNHDHSNAYVVRIVEHQPSLEEQHTAFLQELNSWPGLINMMSERTRGLAGDLAQDLMTGADLKWERTPDKSEQESEESAG
jgi:hypothetical protein